MADAALRLLEYALSLRMYGEGKGETWADWERQAETHLRATRALPPEVSDS